VAKKEKLIEFMSTDGKEVELPLAWLECIIPALGLYNKETGCNEIRYFELRIHGMIYFAVPNRPIGVKEAPVRSL
jgi:hypothetical protein